MVATLYFTMFNKVPLPCPQTTAIIYPSVDGWNEFCPLDEVLLSYTSNMSQLRFDVLEMFAH